MSTSSTPENSVIDAKRLEKMNEDLAAIMPKDFAGAVNMMANPVAGAMAFSAMGLGLANQAFGMWVGAMSGAAEASQRLFMPILVDIAPRADDFAEKPEWPVVRAKAAVSVLVADEPKVPVAVAEPEKELMPEDFSRPKAMDRPEAPDDLKLISGIGPKLEQVLNGLGVWTYGQIAGWGREEIAWVDDYLSFTGRIGRDGWIGQAAKLAVSETKH